MPFIGYLILFNNELVSYFELSNIFTGNSEKVGALSDGAISRLYYLYFGLTMLGITSIAFSFFCPITIKNHRNEYEYSESEVKIMTHSRLAVLVNPYEKLLKDKQEDYKELESYIAIYRNSFADAEKTCPSYETTVARSKELEEIAYLNVLNYIWSYQVKSKYIWRALIAIGYALGFGLVLYPSALVFIDVCLTFFGG